MNREGMDVTGSSMGNSNMAVPAERGPAGLPIRMVRPNMDNIPQIALPVGFSMRSMRMDEIGLWTDIWRDAEPYFQIKDDAFMGVYGPDLPAVERRVFFVVNEPGVATGTISAWYDRDFKGVDAGRIHWVAVRRAFQSRGLAKGMMTFAMNRLAEWHRLAYLDTQSKRIGAIKLYLDFGFLPYMDADGAAEAWCEVAKHLKHPVLAATGIL